MKSLSPGSPSDNLSVSLNHFKTPNNFSMNIKSIFKEDISLNSKIYDKLRDIKENYFKQLLQNLVIKPEVKTVFFFTIYRSLTKK